MNIYPKLPLGDFTHTILKYEQRSKLEPKNHLSDYFSKLMNVQSSGDADCNQMVYDSRLDDKLPSMIVRALIKFQSIVIKWYEIIAKSTISKISYHNIIIMVDNG